MEKKKVFYKKWWFWVIVVIVLAAGTVGMNDDTDSSEKSAKEDKLTQKEVSEVSADINGSDEKKEKEDSLNTTVDLDEQFIFEYFVVTLDKARIYEINDLALMDLHFDWKNNFGEEAKFVRAGSVFAYQGEEELEEITYAYSDIDNDVHATNAANGTWGIHLSFRLIDTETPIRVVFVSHETEKEEELVIDIK